MTGLLYFPELLRFFSNKFSRSFSSFNWFHCLLLLPNFYFTIFRCYLFVFFSVLINLTIFSCVPVHIDNSNKLNDGLVYVTVDPKNQALNEQYQHHSNHIHGQQLLQHHQHQRQQSANHPNQFPPRENSPYNNSSSEKESTSSSINLGGNAFRNSHGMCAILLHCFPRFVFFYV